MPNSSRPSPDAEPKIAHADEIVELGDDDFVLLDDDGDDVVIEVGWVEPVGTVASGGARGARDGATRAEARMSSPLRPGRSVVRRAGIAGGALLFLVGALIVAAQSEAGRRALAPREVVVASRTKAPVAAPPAEGVSSGSQGRPKPPRSAFAAPATLESAASAVAQPAGPAPAPESVAEAQRVTMAEAESAFGPDAASTPRVERATETRPASAAMHPARTRLEGRATRRAGLVARIESRATAPAAPGARAPAAGAPARNERAPAAAAPGARAPAAAAPARNEPAPAAAAPARNEPAPAAAAPARNQPAAAAASASSPPAGYGELPTLPSRAALRAALASATPALRACTSHRGIAMMTLTVGGDGNVRSAAPAGSWGRDMDRACVARAISRVRVPAFARPSLTLRFPFAL